MSGRYTTSKSECFFANELCSVALFDTYLSSLIAFYVFFLITGPSRLVDTFPESIIFVDLVWPWKTRLPPLRLLFSTLEIFCMN